MQPTYPLRLEQAYCVHPSECRNPDIVIIGSGIGTFAARHAIETAKAEEGRTPTVVVLEAGAFDLMGHVGDYPGYSRRPFIHDSPGVGGLLKVWGVSTPDPRPYVLDEWPWDRVEVDARFRRVKAELGVPDPIPMSGKDLELQLLARLRDALDNANVAVAPLAIDRYGRRWTPLKYVPSLRQAGVGFVARFRVDTLEFEGASVRAVSGTWLDGNRYCFTPRHTVIGVGAQRTVPLLRGLVPAAGQSMRDHFRIDAHGVLPPGTFGRGSADSLGVAVLIVEMEDSIESHVPCHIEIKVAPAGLWRNGFMQSSDNLLAAHSEDAIYYQLQVVSAMADPLPLAGDLLNVGERIPAVMTDRDAALHGRLVASVRRIAEVLGIESPTFNFRELTTNHHLYAALRVGREVDEHFLLRNCDNLTVLPPAAYFDHACDANPTLKSLVLAEIAVEHIVRIGRRRLRAADTAVEA